MAKGDVVCLLLPSSIDYAVCYQAAARIGAVTTGVNLRMGAAEQASITARVRPAVTVVDTDVVAEDAVPPGSGTVRGASLALAEAWAAAPTPALRRPRRRTTRSPSCGRVGRPACPRARCSTTPTSRAVAAGTDVLSHPGDRRLSPLPFAHVGYMTRAWDEIAHGVTTVITPQPWTAASAIELLISERVTVGQGVPTQWALMLAHPDFDGADLSQPPHRRHRGVAGPARAGPGHARAPGLSGGGALHLDRVLARDRDAARGRRRGRWPPPWAGPCPGSSSRWSTTTARRGAAR